MPVVGQVLHPSAAVVKQVEHVGWHGLQARSMSTETSAGHEETQFDEASSKY